MKNLLIAVGIIFFILRSADASTVAHWTFNDLTDSSGNGHTIVNSNPNAVLLGGVMTFSGGESGQLVSTPNVAAWSDTSFTVEAIITPAAIPSSGPSTIVAHLADPGGGRQWLFGYNNGALSLLLRQTQEGGGSTEVYYTTTAITPHVNGQTYYVAVTIDLTAATAANRITFFSQNLTTAGLVESGNSSVSFSGTGLAASTAALTFGSTGHSSARFSGSISEIRISDVKLTAGELLIPEPSVALFSLSGLLTLFLRRR